MKYFLLLLTLICVKPAAYCQQVFFKSSQAFSSRQFENFHSAVAVYNNHVFFNANDFSVHAYNKTTGMPLWSYYTGLKSDNAMYMVGGDLWVNGRENVLRIDTATGQLIKSLPVGTIESKPFEKNGIVYTTGLLDGGRIYAYDLAGDSVLWSRFLAHGYSTTPLYFSNHIIANGEGNYWLKMDYSGKLPETCEAEDGTFPSDISCVKTFFFITHDGKEITKWPGEKIDINDTKYFNLAHTLKNTIVATNDELLVFANNKKLKVKVKLNALTETDVLNEAAASIVKYTNDTVWLLVDDYLVEYNYAKKTLVRKTDLSDWQPHQVVMDANDIWLVSKNDGLLYGLRLEAAE